MNCQEALNILYEIIDKEASEIDAHQVQKHLYECRHCFEVYKLEGAMQQFIAERLAHAEPTPCVEALKAKILNRLDDIDAGQKKIRQKFPFGKTALTLAAAAVLVVAVGAALIIASFYRHHDLYIPLEEAHWNASNELHTFQNGTLTAEAESLLVNGMKYHLNPQVASFTMVGGHLEEIDGVEMAHFVYQHGDQSVSVFVAPSDRFQIPDNLQQAAVSRHNLTFFDHHCRGCRLVFHRAGNVVVVTATTDHAIDLLDFIPGSSTLASSI